jgi:hypothetical protein
MVTPIAPVVDDLRLGDTVQYCHRHYGIAYERIPTLTTSTLKYSCSYLYTSNMRILPSHMMMLNLSDTNLREWLNGEKPQLMLRLFLRDLITFETR